MKIGHGYNLVLTNINSVQKIASFLELITRSELGPLDLSQAHSTQRKIKKKTL